MKKFINVNDLKVNDKIFYCQYIEETNSIRMDYGIVEKITNKFIDIGRKLKKDTLYAICYADDYIKNNNLESEGRYTMAEEAEKFYLDTSHWQEKN